YVLSAPTGLSAQYLAEEDEVQVSWNAFNLPDDVDEEVRYIVSVNGEENVQTDTKFTISNPPREELTITVAVQVKSETGPAAEVSILVQEPDEEEENNEAEQPETPEEPEEPEDNGEDRPPEEDNNGSEDSEDNDNNSDENDENEEDNQ